MRKPVDACSSSNRLAGGVRGFRRAAGSRRRVVTQGQEVCSGPPGERKEEDQSAPQDSYDQYEEHAAARRGQQEEDDVSTELIQTPVRFGRGVTVPGRGCRPPSHVRFCHKLLQKLALWRSCARPPRRRGRRRSAPEHAKTCQNMPFGLWRAVDWRGPGERSSPLRERCRVPWRLEAADARPAAGW